MEKLEELNKKNINRKTIFNKSKKTNYLSNLEKSFKFKIMS